MSGTVQRLAYDRCGRGRPLVLLHPLGADRAVWRPVLPYLEGTRDVISVDLPGFGESPALDGGIPPSPDRLAAALLGLLDELGLSGARAHLAGNSLGGWVALEAAAVGRAATVTAIAPAGLWSAPLAPKPQIARRVARFVAPVSLPLMRVPALKQIALAGSVAHPERVPAREAAGMVRAYAQAPGFAAVNRAMRAGVFTELARLEVPVTLVWPSHDRLIARPRRLPPNVDERFLAGCGHVPMWDDPPSVAAVLLDGSAAPEVGK